MALIICSNCGKKVSDTTSECIHCGAKIGVATNDKNKNLNNTKKTNISVDNNEESDVIYKYYSLPFEKQERLENDFLKFDKESAQWQEKSLVVTKFFGAARILLILALIAFSILSFIVKILPDGTIDFDDEKRIMFLGIGVAGYIAVAAICLVVLAISSIIIKLRFGKKKQYVYYRRFSKWLEKKNIVFDIEFASDDDERLYEKIDLKVDKF